MFEMRAQATEQSRTLESTRFLGRGNTFVAALDSDEATRANLSTLAEPDKLRFQLRWFQIDAMVGKNTTNMITDMTKLSGTSSVVSFLQSFRDRSGERQSFRAQVSPLAVRILSFELAPFGLTTNFVDMRNLGTLPEVSIESNSMAGATAAFAMNFAKDFSVGVGIRPHVRYYIGGSLGFADIADFLPPSSREITDVIPMRSGTGLGVNLGGTWRLHPKMRLGLTVDDLGYTGYGAGGPPPIKQSINLGYFWRVYEMAKAWTTDLFFDLHDVMNESDEDYIRHLHMGAEFGRRYFSRDNDFGVVVGVNEGYFTGGLFADLLFLRLDASVYSVESGYYAGQRDNDVRYSFSARSTMTF